MWYGSIDGLETRNQNLFMYAYLRPNHDNNFTFVGGKVNRELKWRLHIKGRKDDVKNWTEFPEQEV